MMEKVRHLPKQVAAFLTEDLWRESEPVVSPGRWRWLRPLRIIVLTGRKFVGDNCPLHASALTFYSLLSVVPLAAMAFGIAKGFGFQKRLQAQLLEKIPGQEEVLLRIIDAADRFLETTRGGLIAGIGVVVLFWTVVKVLGHIETTFNHIWRVTKARSFARRFSDYLTLMLIGPVLFISASSLTVFITTQITAITQKIELLGLISPVIFSALKLLPYAMIWGLLTIVYMVMPNTRVHWGPGLLAGIAAGTIYQITQWLYIAFQVGVTRANAVYGSFAALPLFLAWLQISWLIVLLGAEFAFAFQNVDDFEGEADCRRTSPRQRQTIALAAAQHLVKAFAAGKGPVGVAQLGQQMALPGCLLVQAIEDLLAAGVIVKASVPADESGGYLPAFDIHQMTIALVCSRLAHRDTAPPIVSPALDGVGASLEAIEAFIQDHPANRLLKDIP